MKLHLLIIFIIALATSACIGDDFNYQDNTRIVVYGKIVDTLGNPIPNYTITVRAIRDFDGANQSFTNYENSYTNYSNDLEYLNATRTDAQGNYEVFFPRTSWNEFITTESGDVFKFYNGSEEITANYRIVLLDDFSANSFNAGTLQIILE